MICYAELCARKYEGDGKIRRIEASIMGTLLSLLADHLRCLKPKLSISEIDWTVNSKKVTAQFKIFIALEDPPTGKDMATIELGGISCSSKSVSETIKIQYREHKYALDDKKLNALFEEVISDYAQNNLLSLATAPQQIFG
jgi:hypothetical protein